MVGFRAVSVCRKRKVIVNGLRAMDVRDMIILGCEEFGNSICSRSRVVTTDGHEKLDVVVFEEVEVEVLFEILVSRLETAHFEI